MFLFASARFVISTLPHGGGERPNRSLPQVGVGQIFRNGCKANNYAILGRFKLAQESFYRYCSKSFQLASLSSAHVLPVGQNSKPKTGCSSQLLCLVRWRPRECSESNIKTPLMRTFNAWCGAAAISGCNLAREKFGCFSLTRGVNSAVTESSSSFPSDGESMLVSTSTIWLSVFFAPVSPQLHDSLLPALLRAHKLRP
jgi:hypothetical protein